MAKVDQESVAIAWLQSRAQGALLLHNSDSFYLPLISHANLGLSTGNPRGIFVIGRRNTARMVFIGK